MLGNTVSREDIHGKDYREIAKKCWNLHGTGYSKLQVEEITDAVDILHVQSSP